MDDQKLEDLIQELESNNDQENAYFGIKQYGGGPSESFIQGNKEGLIRFATELLKASKETGEKDGKVIYFIDDEDIWIDDMSEVGISYIEKVDVSRDSLQKTRSSKKDRIAGIGCIILLLLIFVIVGFFVIVGVTSTFS